MRVLFSSISQNKGMEEVEEDTKCGNDSLSLFIEVFPTYRYEIEAGIPPLHIRCQALNDKFILKYLSLVNSIVFRRVSELISAL